MAQSNICSARPNSWNRANCLSRSSLASLNVATLGFSAIEVRAAFHAAIAFAFRASTHTDLGGSSFMSRPAVFALTNCGSMLSVIEQSEGAHTSAGTPAQT